MKNIKDGYLRRKDRYFRLNKKQTKVSNGISNLRLAVFFAGVTAAVLLYLAGYYFLLAADIVVFLFLFGYLVVKHNRLLDRRKRSLLLIEINENAGKRLDGGWTAFPDDGADFADENHAYSGDLDIFGKGSLYQWVNTCKTYIGRQKLKSAFLERPRNVDEIYERQKAIDELAGKLKWRQRFMSEGLLISDKVENPGALIAWCKEKYELFRKPPVILFLRILPLITVLTVFSVFLIPGISYYIPVSLLIVQFLILKLKSGQCAKIFSTAEKYREDIKIYEKMLRSVENLKCSSGYLKALKSSMQDEDLHSASEQVKKLTGITDWISGRWNGFYLIFDIITLWDYQLLIALEKWKAKSGGRLNTWLEVIGELEALSSLAVIRFDHPGWVMPVVSQGCPVFQAEGLGHPLLSENRVCNTLRLEETARILLITGSNMSGKSTLLRTAGISLVLAYAGSPVCAKSFYCSMMDLYTCMRVSDNIEKSISSFYAELLRVKMVIEAVEAGKPVFFLLDELFKGTNSADRHTGARVLINKLSKANILGLVSTHDLELGELAESNGNIGNYHFREYYEENRIHFDYILRPGISTTRNAIYLMKMAGIEMGTAETEL